MADDNVSQFEYGVVATITPKNDEGCGGWRTTEQVLLDFYPTVVEMKHF